MEEKRVEDYIAEMDPDDYEEQFANIENEEKTLKAFLNKINSIDDNILPQVAACIDDAWNLVYEHESIVDFIVDLYKCELTEFHQGGVEGFIGMIKDIINDDNEVTIVVVNEEYEELMKILK